MSQQAKAERGDFSSKGPSGLAGQSAPIPFGVPSPIGPSLALLDELALRALGAREVRPLPGLCDESLAVTGKAAEDPAGDAVARGGAR